MRPTADSEISGPRRTLALNQPLSTLETMAAVAAASAELLIIGWYIFRVLLQVSVSRLPVGTCSPCAHPTPANPRRDCRLPSPSYPDCRDPCPIAAAGIACPPPVPCALLLAQTLPSAPAPGREQRLGRGGRLPRTIAEAFSYLRGKKNPLCPDSTPGGRRGHFCTVRLYSSYKENFPS